MLKKKKRVNQMQKHGIFYNYYSTKNQLIYYIKINNKTHHII